jgi:hypothetical protein
LVEVLCFDEGRLESGQAAMKFCGSADGLSAVKRGIRRLLRFY